MRNQRQPIEEGPPKVPGYIVTYSDMVTLLLTFFVMLMTLASVQDPELFNKGRGSFIQSVEGLGLGILYGRRQSASLWNKRIKYSTDSGDSWSARRMDTREEKLRQIFNEIRQSMETMPSQVVGEVASFSLADVRFSPGEATLNESAKRYLTEFSVHLRQNPRYDADTLYVVGLSGEQTTEKQRWILSARRARAVADFLHDILVPRSQPQTRYGTPSLAPRWRIYWWGAGPGGDWVDRDTPISKQSQVLIAILNASGR